MTTQRDIVRLERLITAGERSPTARAELDRLKRIRAADYLAYRHGATPVTVAGIVF